MKKEFYPMVYISSAYAGDIYKNTEKAKKYSRFALENKKMPLAMHLLFPQFMNDEDERELAMHFNYVILGKCDEVWFFGSKLSKGMKEELDMARRLRKKIRYFDESYKEVHPYA